jgi:hypothetical protein
MTFVPVSGYVPVPLGISRKEGAYGALFAGLVSVLSEGERSLLRMVVVKTRRVRRDLTMDQPDWIDSVLSEHSLLEVRPIPACPADSQLTSSELVRRTFKSVHVVRVKAVDIRIRILNTIQERSTQMRDPPSHTLTARFFPIAFLFPSMTLDT